MSHYKIHPGDAVFYVLPRAPKNGRPTDLYLAATVLTVSPLGWASIRPKASSRARVVKATNLVKTAPEGAWIR